MRNCIRSAQNVMMQHVLRLKLLYILDLHLMPPPVTSTLLYCAELVQ